MADFDNLFPGLRDYAHGRTTTALKAYNLATQSLLPSYHTNLANQQAFDPFHCEGLLNQAADLIDRCIREKVEWDDRAAKAANLSLEIADYFENDAIHQEEIAAGIYTVPFQVSGGEAQAFNELDYWLGQSLSEVRSNLQNQYSNSELNKVSGNEQLLAWLTHVPNHEYPYVGNTLQLSWDNVSNTADIHAKDATFQRGWWTFRTQEKALEAQRCSITGEQAAAKRRFAGINAKKLFDQRDVDFKRRRTMVARRLADLKVSMSTRSGGPLNYSEKMAHIKRRFDRDFADATSRLLAAEMGLKTIYGYKVELPGTIRAYLASGPADTIGEGRLLDDAIDWIREAIAWLIRFSHSDDVYTHAISVRATLGASDFREGRSNGSWTVAVTEEAFQGQRHVRLRGARLYFLSAPSKAVWGATVKCPSKSIFIHRDGSREPIDQSSRRRVRFGNVAERSDSHLPEENGIQALHNCSPIGSWTITVPETAATGESRSSIGGIVLELMIASQDAA